MGRPVTDVRFANAQVSEPFRSRAKTSRRGVELGVELTLVVVATYIVVALGTAKRSAELNL